jgi:hypothetical protein
MIFAHAPAGYILTRILQKKLNTKKHLIWGIVASITPDLDLIYKKYFDPIVGRNHREYITHTPFFWLILFVVG